MKNNYDIPAYHFCIVKKQMTKNEKEMRSGVFYVDKQVKKTLIPFENIDGLLINEVKEVLGIKSITIACTVNTGAEERILSEFCFSSQMLEEKEEDTINSLMKDYCYEHFPDASLEEQRRMNCFLERYVKDNEVQTFRKINQSKKKYSNKETN